MYIIEHEEEITVALMGNQLDVYVDMKEENICDTDRKIVKALTTVLFYNLNPKDMKIARDYLIEEGLEAFIYEINESYQTLTT